MDRRCLLLGVLLVICFSFVVPVSAVVSQYNITVGGDTVHIFNGTGNSTWTVPAGVTSAWVLVVGGGAAGGGGQGATGNNWGGGGGGGALLNGTMTLNPAASIAITVGAGGYNTSNGGYSQFNNTEIAAGGGGGRGDSSTYEGRQGGSGGGGSGFFGGAGGASNATSGAFLTAYGFRGGYGWADGDPAPYGGAGGGGGAGGMGGNGSANTVPGAGGLCFQSSITGTQQNFSAGGGANTYTNRSLGGCPEAGEGSRDNNNPGNGVNGTGSGGGGSWSGYGRQSWGGSGVIIVRYTTPGAPTASFTANTTGGSGSVAVLFTDASTGSPAPSAWNWSFQDVTGNNTQIWFSTVKNATYTFGVGNFSIKLNATSGGGTNISAQTTFVNVSAPSPIASFNLAPTSGGEPLTVTFNDTSTNTPTSWSWSFKNVVGNNTFTEFSTAKNLTYAYTVGNYSIRLNVTNAFGSNTSSQTSFVNVTSSAPVSSFTANQSSGTEPMAVEFIDTSSNSPTSWSWQFRNVTGNNTWTVFSTSMNIVHVFLQGNYQIRLNTTNAYGSSTSAQNAWVNSSSLGAPVTNFTATPRNGSATLGVQFTDTTTGSSLVSWEWDFGDGTAHSTLQNPYHYYYYGNVYDVSLTVMNTLGGADTETKISYINVSLPSSNTTDISIAGSPVLVQFHVQTIWGQALPDAQVQIVAQSTTAGSWDWVQELLGIAFNEAPIQSTTLTGTTDTLGNTEFLMIPTARYNVSTTLAGYTFAPYYITPHDTEYTIVANPLSTESWTDEGVLNESGKNVSVQQIYYSDALQGINVFYNDTTGSTTGGFIFINQSGNATANYSFAITGNMSVHQNLTIPIGGSGAKVNVVVNSTKGNITRTYGLSFEGPAVAIPVFDEQLTFWIAMGLLVLTGMIATASTSPQVSVMLCIEGWIFIGLGWLRPLEDNPLIGRDKVALVMTVATIICIVWVLRSSKRQETGR